MGIIRSVKISVEDKDKSGKPSMGDVVRIERGVGKKKRVTSMPVPKFLNSAKFKFLGDEAVRRKLIGLPARRLQIAVKRFGMPNVNERIISIKASETMLESIWGLLKHFPLTSKKIENATVEIEITKGGKKRSEKIPVLQFLTDAKFNEFGDTLDRVILLKPRDPKRMVKVVKHVAARMKEEAQREFLHELLLGIAQDALGSGGLDESRLQDMVAEYRDYKKLKNSLENPFDHSRLFEVVSGSFPNDLAKAFDLYNSIMKRLGVSDRLLLRAKNSRGKIIEAGGAYETQSPPSDRGVIVHVDYLLKSSDGIEGYTFEGTAFPIDRF